MHRRMRRRPIRGCRLERLYGLRKWHVFWRKCRVMLELCRRSIYRSRLNRMQQLRSWELLACERRIVQQLFGRNLRLNRGAHKCLMHRRLCTRAVLPRRRIVMLELRCGSVWCNDGVIGCIVHRRMCWRPIRGCRLERLHGLQRWSVFRRKRGVVHELCRRSICGRRIKRMQQLRIW